MESLRSARSMVGGRAALTAMMKHELNNPGISKVFMIASCIEDVEGFEQRFLDLDAHLLGQGL